MFLLFLLLPLGVDAAAFTDSSHSAAPDQLIVTQALLGGAEPAFFRGPLNLFAMEKYDLSQFSSYRFFSGVGELVRCSSPELQVQPTCSLHDSKLEFSAVPVLFCQCHYSLDCCFHQLYSGNSSCQLQQEKSLHPPAFYIHLPLENLSIPSPA